MRSKKGCTEILVYDSPHYFYLSLDFYTYRSHLKQLFWMNPKVSCGKHRWQTGSRYIYSSRLTTAHDHYGSVASTAIYRTYVMFLQENMQISEVMQWSTRKVTCHEAYWFRTITMMGIYQRSNIKHEYSIYSK